MPHERGRVPPQPALPPGEAFPTGGLASCPEPGSGRYRQDSLLPVSGFPARRRARWRRQPRPTPRQRGVPHHRATSCLAAQEAPPASGREPVGPRPPARARRALVRPTSRPPAARGSPTRTLSPQQSTPSRRFLTIRRSSIARRDSIAQQNAPSPGAVPPPVAPPPSRRLPFSRRGRINWRTFLTRRPLAPVTPPPFAEAPSPRRAAPSSRPPRLLLRSPPHPVKSPPGVRRVGRGGLRG